MWDIIRTKPAGTHLGKAIPIFINNFHQYLTKINAFADGAIDVWGFLDLPLFDAKMETGWVSTRPPKGSRVGVHNLGAAMVAKGEWRRNPEQIREQVWSVVRGFDPELRNVIDMEGSETYLDGKLRCAKLGLSDACPVRIDDSEERLLGQSIPLFQHDGNDVRLLDWFIFSDGSSRLGFDGPIVDFEQVCSRLRDGDLTTSANEARWIEIPSLGRFKPQDGHWDVEPEQRILEARDVLSELQGNPNAVRVCVDALRRYQEDPSQDHKDQLREAYESVPDHLKLYCGDMDTKDRPIRRILYPED